MDRTSCRVTADLRRYESENSRLDRDQAMIEEAAEPGFIDYMKNLDSDIIDAALDGLTLDEYESLEEDCGMSDMRDAAHAGTIVMDAIERYCRQLAIKDEMDKEE